jgi:hypothetical protein
MFIFYYLEVKIIKKKLFLEVSVIRRPICSVTMFKAAHEPPGLPRSQAAGHACNSRTVLALSDLFLCGIYNTHYSTPSKDHHPFHKMSSTTATLNEPITAQSILRLFPDIDTSSAELDGHDEEQIRSKRSQFAGSSQANLHGQAYGRSLHCPR